MIMSRRPDLIDSNYTIFNILKHSAEDTVGIGELAELDTPGWDRFYGWGRANAFRALLSVIRGDINNDGNIDMIDITLLINFKYKNGPPPVIDVATGDTNCDGSINILDITVMINYVCKGRPAPSICFDYYYPEYRWTKLIT